MAEASLDDFFAKKDKKGKKSKSKLTPSELLAKQDAEIKPAKKKKEKDKSQSRQTQSSTTSGSSSVVDEVLILDGQEWNEVHEESEKDYTGLRIQNLQISKEEEDEESDRRESDEEGGGEDGKERREAREGPWNKGGQPSQPESAPQPPPEPEPTPKPEEPKATGKYVPPSARYAATASATSNISQMRKKKGAPNIRSEEDFPTLGGGAPGGGGVRWGAPEHGDRSFERVRGGNKQMDDPSSKNLSLTLGNKFQALKQE